MLYTGIFGRSGSRGRAFHWTEFLGKGILDRSSLEEADMKRDYKVHSGLMCGRRWFHKIVWGLQREDSWVPIWRIRTWLNRQWDVIEGFWVGKWQIESFSSLGSSPSELWVGSGWTGGRGVRDKSQGQHCHGAVVSRTFDIRNMTGVECKDEAQLWFHFYGRGGGGERRVNLWQSRTEWKS